MSEVPLLTPQPEAAQRVEEKGGGGTNRGRQDTDAPEGCAHSHHRVDSASRGFTDFPQVDTRRLRHKSVNFRAGKSPGEADWRAQID